MYDLDHMCTGRQLEFGRKEEKNNPSLADLTIGHAIKDYIRGSWGKIIGIVFDNDIIMTTYDNGNIVWYDNHTVFEFDLYMLMNTFNEPEYYIHKEEAELELEQSCVRHKHGKQECPDIRPGETVKLVHLKKTAYQIRTMNIVDEGCGFVNQDKNWLDYLTAERAKGK